jgi:hypothetical protein
LTRRWWAAAGAVAIVALVVLGIWVSRGDGGPDEGSAPLTVPDGVDPSDVDPSPRTGGVDGPSANATGDEIPPDPDLLDEGDGEPVARFLGPVTDPVPVDQVGEFGDGVTVRLARLEAVEAEGSLPGEHSGPAVAVTVAITNGTTETIDVGTVTVDLVDARGRSASPVIDPEQPPLRGEVPAGATASGSYVFSLPPERRSEISVGVRYAASAPTVVFTGAAPPA